MRKIIYCSEVFGYYYVDFKFEDSKRVVRAEVHDDENGQFFVSQKKKYYLKEIYEELKKSQ